MQDNSKWFVCECSGEALRVERYEEKHVPTEYWISLYRIGNWNPSLLWRIKAAWKVLIKGSLHEDQITLSKKTAKKLGEYLNNE